MADERVDVSVAWKGHWKVALKAVMTDFSRVALLVGRLADGWVDQMGDKTEGISAAS